MNKKQAELQRVTSQLNSEEKYLGFDDSVMQAARQQAEATLVQAKKQAEELYESLTASRRSDPLEAYRAEAQTKLERENAFQQQENRKKLLIYRRQLVNALFAEQAEAMQEYCRQACYIRDMEKRMQLLKPLVKKQPLVLVRPGEEDTLGACAQAIFEGCKIVADSSIQQGGFKLETGRVRYDETLDFAQKAEYAAFLMRCNLRIE